MPKNQQKTVHLQKKSQLQAFLPSSLAASHWIPQMRLNFLSQLILIYLRDRITIIEFSYKTPSWWSEINWAKKLTTHLWRYKRNQGLAAGLQPWWLSLSHKFVSSFHIKTNVTKEPVTNGWPCNKIGSKILWTDTIAIHHNYVAAYFRETSLHLVIRMELWNCGTWEQTLLLRLLTVDLILLIRSPSIPLVSCITCLIMKRI